MTRFLFVIPFILMTSAASAQQGNDVCARDASRFCRKYLEEGDQVVLACLKQNRTRLSRGCQDLLTRHGQ